MHLQCLNECLAELNSIAGNGELFREAFTELISSQLQIRFAQKQVADLSSSHDTLLTFGQCQHQTRVCSGYYTQRLFLLHFCLKPL